MGEKDRGQEFRATREASQRQVGTILERLGVPKGDGIGLEGVPIKWHPKDKHPRLTGVILSRTLISFSDEPGLDGVHLFDAYVFSEGATDILHFGGTDGDVGFDYRAPTEDEKTRIGLDPGVTIVEMMDDDHQLLEEESIQDPSGLDVLRFRLAQVFDHIAA